MTEKIEGSNLVEVKELEERYRRRGSSRPIVQNKPLKAEMNRERDRAFTRLFRKHSPTADLSKLKVLEVGSGFGDQLIRLLELGFSAENLVGIELLEDRVTHSRERLPQGLRIINSDALSAAISESSYDIVFQSTAFSSILDSNYQSRLAQRMLELLNDNGAVLWYDFVYNNPSNKDVVGMPLSRVKELFPNCKIHPYRITLLPPLARTLVKIHPKLYRVFVSLPFLRSHLLCWIQKEK